MTDSMPTRPSQPARPSGGASLQEWTVYHLAAQSAACRILGSQLYAHLLAEAAEDTRRKGPTWAVLEPHATADTGAALALRFMAAVHRLVLTGRAPALARHYASVGGTEGPQGAWPALRAALADHADDLRSLVGLACQTNEVGRCAALVGGFLSVARVDGRPLRLLEIGSSAGLNLRWDRYRYEHRADDRAWGDPDSPVRLRGDWQVPPQLLDRSVEIAERRGCDPQPVDPLSEDGRLALASAVWGDQPLRHERLRGALRVAARLPVTVERARAAEWLPSQLDVAHDGPTVVFHSVVMQYLPPPERDAVVAAIAAAGTRATREKPLHWLRMEPEDRLRAMAVRLTSWPDGAERLLARSGAHGDPVRWRAQAAPPDSVAP